MRTKPYKATSLTGAQREVRMLRKQREQLMQRLTQFTRERRTLAMLAADGPCFHNPLIVYEAKQIRDKILREECRLNPDGTPLQ